MPWRVCGKSRGRRGAATQGRHSHLISALRSPVKGPRQPSDDPLRWGPGEHIPRLPSPAVLGLPGDQIPAEACTQGGGEQEGSVQRFKWEGVKLLCTKPCSASNTVTLLDPHSSFIRKEQRGSPVTDVVKDE